MTMSNNESSEQTRLSFDNSKDIDDEKLWKTFGINFHSDASRFPDNKIYANIFIKPESARKLIRKFALIVNGSVRGEFSRDYREMSVSGFDMKKKENSQISVEIKAIPFNDGWKMFPKTSEPCIFSFTNEIFGLSPTVSYLWEENNSEVTVGIKWYHLGDKCAHKYIVRLDNKEIQYIYQSSIRHELEVHLHNLQTDKKHTIQVVATLKNGKETYRSDVIDFIVPKEKNEQNSEVINVTNEPIPSNLLAVLEVADDKKKKQLARPPSPGPPPPPASEPALAQDEFRERALELLQLLIHQIEKRNAS